MACSLRHLAATQLHWQEGSMSRVVAVVSAYCKLGYGQHCMAHMAIDSHNAFRTKLVFDSVHTKKPIWRPSTCLSHCLWPRFCHVCLLSAFLHYNCNSSACDCLHFCQQPASDLRLLLASVKGTYGLQPPLHTLRTPLTSVPPRAVFGMRPICESEMHYVTADHEESVEQYALRNPGKEVFEQCL